MTHELDDRIQRVLDRLRMISEASSTARFDTGHTQPDSNPPAGVRLDANVEQLGRDRPPPKDRSLHDFYAWHFANATSDYRRRLLLFLAERDIDRRTHRTPVHLSPTTNDHETPDERDDRLIEWYEGVDVLEAAVLEEVSVKHLEVLRRRRGRNPDDGRENPFAAAARDERAERARQLKRLGYSIRAIALELGVPKSTVARYLDETNGERAA